MINRTELTDRIKLTVFPTKGDSYRKDISLPYSDFDTAAKSAELSFTFCRSTPETGEKVFTELSFSSFKTTVYSDGETLAERDGIQSPLRLDVTRLADGEMHEIKIELKPLASGNNRFGKIFFFETGDSHFDVLSRGDCGITVTSAISENAVDIIVTAQTVNPNNYDVLRCTLISPDGEETVKTSKPTSSTCVFSPENVRFWNGQHEAPLYRIRTELLRDSKLLDSAETVFGVRKISFSDGFLTVNGVKLPLNGISPDVNDMHPDDGDLFDKLDANCVIVELFPNIDEFLDECDRKGIVAWVDMTTRHLSAPEETPAVIQSLAHHPSFVFAGIDSSDEKTLEAFCSAVKSNSDSVLTAGKASFPEEEAVSDAIPDVLLVSIAPNTPLDRFSELGNRFSEFISGNRLRKTAVRANSPEGFFDRHSDNAARADCSQEFFALWHEKYWQNFAAKKGVFGCFAGNLSDKNAPAGRNGLVSFDREDIKDAFWFYKAHFSAESFVKLCSAQSTMTDKKYIDIRCYTNEPGATLSVNGKAYPKQSCEEAADCVYIFRNVKLKRRNNIIVLTSGGGTDSAVIYRSKSKLKKV